MDQLELNEYGKYFLSEENVMFLNQQLQKLLFEQTGILISPQPPSIIFGYQRIAYREFGHYEYPSVAENQELVRQLNIYTLTQMVKEIMSQMDMRQKVIKRRRRVQKLVNQPQLKENVNSR